MVLFGLRLDSDDEFKTDVVLKKAKCTSCHVGFNFTDEQFHNLGVGWDDDDRQVRRPRPLGHHARSAPRTTPRSARSRRRRSATSSGPPPTCTTAARRPSRRSSSFYDKGGNPNPSLDKDMKKLNLTAQEKADLVAFMKALTGEAIEGRPADPARPAPTARAPTPAAALKPPAPPKTASFHPGLAR